VAALVGAGLVDLWATRLRVWIGGIAVGAVCLGSAWFGATLLDRTPTFDPGLGPVAITLAAVALAGLVATTLPALAGRTAIKKLALVAAALGVCATLIAPAAYAIETTGTAYGGGDPHPGPGTASGFGPGGGIGGGGGFGAGGAARAGLPGDGGGLGGDTSDSPLLDYLVANRGNATWIVATSGSQEAGSIEIATGLPVMAMGGFTGSDPTPTLDQLKSYIASGQLRFILMNSGAGGGGFGGMSDRSAWIAASCSTVNYGRGYAGGGGTLYDCAGAA
jgi:hypothetical protein